MGNNARYRKTLQELTFKDNFMFAATMLDEENAKGVLERVLNQKIEHVEIVHEKNIVYNPEYKGVRLDVYIKDDKHTHYDVEMQVVNKKVFKRARYYHSQIDMELLEAGVEYEELPKAYVIFICDYDPIGLGKYKYTLCQKIQEDKTYEYDDGSHTIFLSTVGKNDDEESKELIQFLKFAGADLAGSNREYEDAFVRRLQESVNKIKFDREMGRRYMTMKELLKDEFQAGKAEGKVEGKAEVICSFLSDIAPLPDNLKSRIASIEDSVILDKLSKIAARVNTIEEFICEMNAMHL